MQSNRSNVVLVGSILVLLLFVEAFLSMNVGASQYGFADFFDWLNGVSGDEQDLVFSELRLPRTLAAICGGGALGLAGLLLQNFLQNNLAEPYTLGLSGSAALGAILAIFFGMTPLEISLPLFSTIGAILATGLLLLSAQTRNLNRKTILLIGVMISFFCSAVVVLLVNLVKPHEAQAALLWLTGYFGSERDHLWPVILTAILTAGAWVSFRKIDLDKLLLGEEIAQSSGVPIKNIRNEVIVIVAFLTASTVSVCGLVGFVGLLAGASAAAVAKSPRYGKTATLSLLFGANFLLVADLLGRVFSTTQELPAGGLTALVGAPFLIHLLLRRAA